MPYISQIKMPGNSNTYLLKDTEARAAIAALQTTVASALVFKGVVSSATAITGLTNYKLGWTYKASASFTIEGLGKVENGDMIVCIAGGDAFNAANWNIVQNNTDTLVGATASAAGSRGLVPAPAAGNQNYFLRGDGSWAAAPDQQVYWGKISDLI